MNMLGFDKVMHLLLGAAVAMVAIAIGVSEWNAFYLAVVVGALKEFRDSNGSGTVDAVDYLATALGGAAVGLWWPWV